MVGSQRRLQIAARQINVDSDYKGKRGNRAEVGSLINWDRLTSSMFTKNGQEPNLHQRLGALPPRSAERRQIMQETAALYGVAEVTLYRMLREHARPRSLRRADYGVPP